MEADFRSASSEQDLSVKVVLRHPIYVCGLSVDFYSGISESESKNISIQVRTSVSWSLSAP